MHESSLGSCLCNRQPVPKEGIASLMTSRKLSRLRPLFEASSGKHVFMYDIWFWHYSRCSTLPVENFPSSDVKHMSLEVPAEADTVDSTLVPSSSPITNGTPATKPSPGALGEGLNECHLDLSSAPTWDWGTTSNSRDSDKWIGTSRYVSKAKCCASVTQAGLPFRASWRGCEVS